MRGWLQAALLVVTTVGLASANEYPLVAHLSAIQSISLNNHPANQDLVSQRSDGDEQQCSGMFNKKAWGGNDDPIITVKFTPHHDNHIVSMIIFEFKDEGFLGRYPSEDSFDVCTLSHPRHAHS